MAEAETTPIKNGLVLMLNIIQYDDEKLDNLDVLHADSKLLEEAISKNLGYEIRKDEIEPPKSMKKVGEWIDDFVYDVKKEWKNSVKKTDKLPYDCLIFIISGWVNEDKLVCSDKKEKLITDIVFTDIEANIGKRYPDPWRKIPKLYIVNTYGEYEQSSLKAGKPTLTKKASHRFRAGEGGDDSERPKDTFTFTKDRNSLLICGYNNRLDVKDTDEAGLFAKTLCKAFQDSVSLDKFADKVKAAKAMHRKDLGASIDNGLLSDYTLKSKN